MLNKKSTFYQIFVRNFSNKGDFKSVSDKLEQLRELGVDIIYLMPINEIGEKERKGSIGSPYAIKDYFQISPDLGTIENFVSLVNQTHQKGMKIILDMVFNHTSPDNVLVNSHPEYYFLRDGKFANKVGDWTDIIDLETSREDTQEYLLTVLDYYLKLGVDGFRFDVSSVIPLEFFIKARKRFGNEIIFLGESASPHFIEYAKSKGFIVTKDDDAYTAFDVLYNYNWYHDLENHYRDGLSLKIFVDKFNADQNHRIICLENHDTERILKLVDGNLNKFTNLVKMMFKINGNPFIYAGMEYGNNHRPQLFEKDPIPQERKINEIYLLFKQLIKEKKLEKDIKHQSMKYIDENNVELTTTYIDGLISIDIFNI